MLGSEFDERVVSFETDFQSDVCPVMFYRADADE